MSVVYKLILQKDLKVPVYKQISNGIMEMVRQGTLKVGDRLPTERELAEHLGIARGTVSKAYETLTHNSVIEVLQGSGSFISSKQDVVEGERKDLAIGILKTAIQELFQLRFTPQEMSTFFQLLLSRYEENHAQVRILAVDCNTESLALFEKQLFYIKNLNITKMLLSDLVQGQGTRESLGHYDLILTTTSHYRDVVAAVPQFKDRVIQCSLTLAQQTIMDLAQLSADAMIGVLCETSRFYDIVVRHLAEMQIPVNSVSYFNEQRSAEELRSFLADKRVIICKTNFFAGQVHSMTSFGEFLSRGGSLIYFNYQIDRGTLHHIEDRIHEALRGKEV